MNLFVKTKKGFSEEGSCACCILVSVLMLSLVAAVAADLTPPKLVFESASNASLGNEVKRAIDKGRVWLAKNQDTNGSWSTPDHPAITALALAALHVNPGSPEQRTETAAVKRGYDYLLNCARADGGIYRKDLPSYNTSLAVMALVLANRAEYQPLILKARKFLIGLQADFDEPGKLDNAFDGGIGYGSKHSWDGKQVADSGDLNWSAAIHFIQNCQNLPSHNSQPWASDDAQNRGGFIYAPGRSMAGETNLASGRVALRSYGSMSYAGLLSYIHAYPVD